MKFLTRTLFRTGVLVGILAFVSLTQMYIQAAYTAPTQDPPGGNVDAPVNVHTDFQDVIGGIQADVIGVSYGISLAGNNRTTADGWPANGSGTADCHLETRRVDWTVSSRTFEGDSGVSQTQYPTCDDYLTSEAKAAGWAASGVDNCLGTNGTQCDSLTRPSTCIYMRLVCASGITVSNPLVATSTYGGTPIALPVMSSTTNPL